MSEINDQPKNLPARAGDTTENNPWPLSVYSLKFRSYIANAPSAWIEAEVVSIKKYPRSCYMKLKDLTEEAFLSASSFYDRTLSQLESINEGAHLVLQMRPVFWHKRGEVSMEIMHVKTIGTGDLLAKIEQLKQKLSAEGLFDSRNKKPLPFLPREIGLICGKGAQAKDDVLENAHRRWPNQKFQIREVRVGNHGETASQVVKAVQELDSIETVDVIVIARGGGSIEEVVIPFSDESLIRGVYSIQTPVVSAIGHETDMPLLDFVADYRASTPTDAAKNVVPDLSTEVELVDQMWFSIDNRLKQKLNDEKQVIKEFESRSVLKNIQSVFDVHRQNIDQYSLQIKHLVNKHFQNESAYFGVLDSKLNAFAPEQVLKRGYSILFDENKEIVKSVENLKDKQLIDIKFYDGEVSTEIKKIDK